MTLQPRVCPGCGGPVPVSARRCTHCGAWFEENSPSTRSASRFRSLFAGLPVDAGEFGIQGSLPLILGLVLAGMIYATGWLLEDTLYWLAPGAVALWGALLPIWLAVVALTWRTRLAVWPIGLGIALGIMAFHLGIVWMLRQRINDDLLGIAAIYAALALAGWLLGRLLHLTLRRRRIRTQVD